jgi:6-pyruvoyltetrahydropterin/6-carboxytetrahydropterin synthase
MIRLTREVRFALASDRMAVERPLLNSWEGWPPATGMEPGIVLRCTVAGEPDPSSGYLCDIKRIDELVRREVVSPLVGNALPAGGAELTRIAWQKLSLAIDARFRLVRLEIMPNPWLSWYCEAETEAMIHTTRQFEFSASHRLHNRDLPDEVNRALFGKCNNPHGHGHNYVVEITLAHAENDPPAPAGPFQAVVRERVIDRLDHRYLNVEVAEFEDLNPTVENIAVVIWNWLVDAIPAGELTNVRVYETPRTWADYSG